MTGPLQINLPAFASAIDSLVIEAPWIPQAVVEVHCVLYLGIYVCIALPTQRPMLYFICSAYRDSWILRGLICSSRPKSMVLSLVACKYICVVEASKRLGMFLIGQVIFAVVPY